jgi:type II secretory pathway component PulL
MLWSGAALVTAGAAAIYWPAALVVAGVLLMRIAAAADVKRQANARQRSAEQTRATTFARSEPRTATS